MGGEIDAKSIRNRSCDGDVLGDIFWKPQTAKSNSFRTQFWEPFRAKIEKYNKMLFEKSLKKRSPKNMKFDAKGIPKWSQHRCKTHQKYMPKVVTKKIRKIITNHASLKSKIIEIHWKTMFFDGLEVCMCEQ